MLPWEVILDPSSSCNAARLRPQGLWHCCMGGVGTLSHL